MNTSLNSRIIEITRANPRQLVLLELSNPFCKMKGKILL